jgi:hypothetical protein
MSHTSANFTKKAPGHNDEATKDNIIGVPPGVANSLDEVGTFR